MKCKTCGDELSEERVELGFDYCLKKECFEENHVPLTIVKIAQNKTNAEYKILDEKTSREMSEGKFRRDPVVVKRESSQIPQQTPRVQPRPRRIVKVSTSRAKFVQSLQSQGYQIDEIVKKGSYMNLTRGEAIRYMTGRRM